MTAQGPNIDVAEHAITVLLIDDQRIIAEAVRRMLLGEDDIHFHHTTDPSKALDLVREISPTVILQDLVMPGVDGLSLVETFRRHESTREIPIIVLSAKEGAEVKADAFARGANDYMVKFPDRLELIARLRYHSQGYIHRLQRNEAYRQLRVSQQQLAKRNRFIRETFGRYLSDEVVESVLETPAGLALGGEKRQVTILMSDLRGFTSLSESLRAEQVVSLLNNYLGEMTDVILEHGGTIDEFIGDAILVIFGAPVLRSDDAARAVACALCMQRRMAEVNEWNRAQDLPQLEMGIGVHTGEVVVGNIGSRKRAKYGVVGSAVNLTARIESCTVGEQILISDFTRREVTAELRIEGEIEVEPKGVLEPLSLFEIAGIGSPYDVKFERSEDTFTDLEEGIEVEFGVLEGKHGVGDRSQGYLLSLSSRHAELVTPEPIEPLTNLRMSFFPDEEESAADFYAKVLGRPARHEHAVVIRFTSVPLVVEQRLQEAIANAPSARTKE